ncbi:BTB/POZ domain-containing protein 1 isoform X2 [Neopsephotus bourkii]|uniref:BTB/POZ domain-containing protein 1 isoform X2 n=1 Tax=Neopsephotus bourkii TaxID=309878 RepID=UPI002AA5C887|nr:BTB/POZ domain-containing protein 1 isoform X2 [Neopsephotus bourkii]
MLTRRAWGSWGEDPGPSAPLTSPRLHPCTAPVRGRGQDPGASPLCRPARALRCPAPPPARSRSAPRPQLPCPCAAAKNTRRAALAARTSLSPAARSAPLRCRRAGAARSRPPHLPVAARQLKRFLYSDEVQIGPETVMTTLYTAKKYAVPALEAHCVDFLTKHLRADNAFMLLTQARLFDEPQLASLCLDTIDKSTMDAISAEGFTDIDIDTLCAVLERDTLSIRESRLFGAVVRWAEAECQRQQLPVTFGNKQKVLGRALSLIRFPLMTIEEFAAGPAQSGILSDREVVNLFLHFTVNPKPKVDYIDRPRCCLRGKECSINRFQQVESRWGYSGTSDRIRFTVNRRISIVGFGLYGSIHGPTDYQVNIQIIDYEKNQTLGQNDTGFSCDGTASTFRVMFKEPIEILPTVCYTACATLKGPDSHYGTKGLKKVIHESPTASKTCFVFYSSPGNNNGTSIEDGQIPEIIFYT